MKRSLSSQATLRLVATLARLSRPAMPQIAVGILNAPSVDSLGGRFCGAPTRDTQVGGHEGSQRDALWPDRRYLMKEAIPRMMNARTRSQKTPIAPIIHPISCIWFIIVLSSGPADIRSRAAIRISRAGAPDCRHGLSDMIIGGDRIDLNQNVEPRTAAACRDPSKGACAIAHVWSVDRRKREVEPWLVVLQTTIPVTIAIRETGYSAMPSLFRPLPSP